MSQLSDTRLALLLRPLERQAMQAEIERMYKELERLPIPAGGVDTIFINPHFQRAERVRAAIHAQQQAIKRHEEADRVIEQATNRIWDEARQTARTCARCHTRIAELADYGETLSNALGGASGAKRQALERELANVTRDLADYRRQYPDACERLRALVGSDDWRALLAVGE